MNPGTVEAGGGGREGGAGREEPGRGGACTCSLKAPDMEHSPQPSLGAKRLDSESQGRNKLWKGSKSLRPPSIILKRETCVARTGTSQLFLLS